MVAFHGSGEASGLFVFMKKYKRFQWLVASPFWLFLCRHATSAREKSVKRGRSQRLMPSKLAAMPRANSDQSKPSASAR